ncbi:MAG: DUF4038 domain-containing protein [Verrucomicrobiales bacterium]
MLTSSHLKQALLLLLCFWFASVGEIFTPGTQAAERRLLVPKWERVEVTLQSRTSYSNPLQDLTIAMVLTSPSGLKHVAYGFWDGGKTWRIRFSPAEIGKWTYETSCSDNANKGLHGVKGEFHCTAATGKNRFTKHGPVRVSNDGFFLLHEDGEPFFWMADTAWNGPLMSTREDWNLYVRERARQKFTVSQWIATQWRSAPNGNRLSQMPYSGRDIIHINPLFFQDLDQKVNALNDAGIMSSIVMLWANGGGSHPAVNPGIALPESQMILLCRYMTARWGAHHVSWMLGGDGDYRGANAAKWLRVGRAVFGKVPHAPVTMHPGGMQWVLDEFRGEQWYDFVGYQSGHGDDAQTLKWLLQGPPAQDWKREPHRPFINLEPPYERHISYQSRQRITPEQVRRAAYWSLLVAPTAGVSYGGHGVWGWDDGSKEPVDHSGTGIPLPWKKAINMPGAEQMTHLFQLFNSFDFWRLRPAPEALGIQPGKDDPVKFVAVARAEYGDLLVAYLPEAFPIDLLASHAPARHEAFWFNPRTGEKTSAEGTLAGDKLKFEPTEKGDWVLVLEAR